VHLTEPAVVDNLRREPDLAIKGGEHRLDVWYHRLDLDDGDGAVGRVHREHVDRAAFSEDLEGHLVEHRPATRSEEPRDRIHQSRVIGVEEPIQLFSVPQHPDRESGVEGAEDTAQERNGEPIGFAAFQTGDR
jgi:hypothetical protein